MMQQLIQLYETDIDGIKQYIVSDIVIQGGKLLATYSDINQIVQLQNMTIMNTGPDVTYYTRTLTDAGRDQISATSSASQKGSKNNMFGTRWIHSLTKKKSKRIRTTDELPAGWFEGRKMKFKD